MSCWKCSIRLCGRRGNSLCRVQEPQKLATIAKIAITAKIAKIEDRNSWDGNFLRIRISSIMSLRFVTLSGVPIEITQLRWPFHRSTSGSDWFVLHGRVALLEDASKEKLHAEVAVAITQTMKDALGSLEPQMVEGMVVNAIRKTIDNGQLAFLKSGKLQPVHVTSRYYSFLLKKVQFPTQSEQEALELIKRRVFWLGQKEPVDVAPQYDCEYVNLSPEKMLELARQLAKEGMILLEGGSAQPGDGLRKEEASIRAAMQKGVDAGIAATKVSA